MRNNKLTKIVSLLHNLRIYNYIFLLNSIRKFSSNRNNAINVFNLFHNIFQTLNFTSQH